MDLYHITLFLHIGALLAAFGASALGHYSEVRMTAARTTGDLRQWGAVAGSVEKVFPVALLILVVTGAYMVSSAWTWSEGWIDVALVGVVLLFVSGGFLGSRGKALGRALQGDPRDPVSPAAARMVRDPVTRSVSFGNTGMAIGIVFIMVTKPDLLGSIVSLVVAIILGMALAIPLWRGRPAGAAPSLADAGARGRA